MSEQNNYTTVIHDGLSGGSALAMILSFSVNHSVLWAILHGATSWLYVIYYVIAY